MTRSEFRRDAKPCLDRFELGRVDGHHREPGCLQVADPAGAAPAIGIFMDRDDLFLRGPASDRGEGSDAGDQHNGRTSCYRAMMGHGRAFLSKQSNHRRALVKPQEAIYQRKLLAKSSLDDVAAATGYCAGSNGSLADYIRSPHRRVGGNAAGRGSSCVQAAAARGPGNVGVRADARLLSACCRSV